MSKPSLAANVSLSSWFFLREFSISPNPRCWYRETRWSASNQRQDPSSSFASSYSWRARVEGVVLSISLSLSLSLSRLLRFAPSRLSNYLPVGDSTTSISDSDFTCSLTLRLSLFSSFPFCILVFVGIYLCLLSIIFRNYIISFLL